MTGKLYGTLGPACADTDTLRALLRASAFGDDRRARVARDTHAATRERCELLLGRLGDGFFFLAL